MARQRIHNSRSGTGAGNAGASWISYSDIMAALLLVFVLMLCVSLYRYFEAETAKEKELAQLQLNIDTQAEELKKQQIILLGQQEKLDEQTMQLAAQQVTMDNQAATIIIIQGELSDKQAELAGKQSELDQAYIILGQQQDALAASQAELDKTREDLENQKLEFALQTQQLSAMVGIKADIIAEVSGALSRRGVSASIDPDTGDIMISSRQLTFQTNSAELTAESKAFLERFVPVYMEVLMRPEYADYLGTIIIEGHTDMSGSYERNMELSQERALEVLLYIRNNIYAGDYYMQNRLDDLLVAMGKGYSDPVYTSFGTVDPDASRRVEFKFSLRDAEMIEEINKLLNSD